MSETKSIKVSPETHQTLTAIGRKGESYDAILVRLIAHYAKDFVSALGEALGDVPDIEKEAENQ